MRGFDMDAAVSPHGQCRTDGFLILRWANRYNDHLFSTASLFQTKRLFNGNFIKRVHGHFYIGQFNAAIISFDAHLYVIINHPFYRDQNFHVILLISSNDSEPNCLWPC